VSIRVGQVVMGVLYVAAGAMHFVAIRNYERIMPSYLPAHHELVLLSGAAEIAGGLGVIIPGRRRAASWGLVMLLIAVLPANVWMAQHPDLFPNIPHWALWARLPLQLPLIWWAWKYTRTED
jgi:uncharacterized membrane protein